LRPLLALVGIFKNEASNIKEVLDSANPFVDRMTLLDTRSIDNTLDIIENYLADNSKNSSILLSKEAVTFDGVKDRRIIDFAANRNVVLDREAERTGVEGESAEFSLMLSGNETLVGGENLRAFLEEHRNATDDAYTVMIETGPVAFPYPRVLRMTGERRRYIFPIHEVPVGKDFQTGGPLIPGVKIVHSEPDPTRLYRRMREVDIPLLNYLAEAPVTDHIGHISRARAIMHLANTHEKLAEAEPRVPESKWLFHKMAAMSYFKQRADLEGSSEDVHYALFKYLNVAEQIEIYNDVEMVIRLEELVKLDPRRPEVWYMLAAHSAQIDPRKGAYLCRETVRVAKEAKENPLFLPSDTRVEWLAYRIAAECAKVLGKKDAMKTAADRGIAAGGPKEVFSPYLENA